MFNIKLFRRHENHPPIDDRLDELLHQWQSIKPSATFQAGVWDRIGQNSIQAPRQQTWLTPRLVWVNSLAAAAGIAIGVGYAITQHTPHAAHPASATLLHSQTLAGSYLAMVTGGAP